MPTQAKSEVNTFTLTILLIGIFPGFAASLIFGRQTFMLIDDAFYLFLVLGGIAFLIHLPFRKKLSRFWAEFAAYCFAGWGTILLALFLSSNYLFHSKPATASYNIHPGTVQAYSFPLRVKVEDPKFNDYGYMMDFDQDEVPDPGHISEVRVTTAKGFWGYEVLLKKELR